VRHRDVGHHLVATSGAADQQDLAPRRVHPRVIVTGVAAAAFGALQCRLGDAFADQQQVPQVEGQVPAGVVLPVSLDVDVREPLAKLVDPAEGLGDLIRLADDPHQVVHRLLQLELQRVGVLRASAVRRCLERSQRPLRGGLDGVLRDFRTAAQRAHVVGGAEAGPTAEDQEVRKRVSAESVRAVHTAGALAGSEQSGNGGSPVSASTSMPPMT
jgi:hypothetical protein